LTGATRAVDGREAAAEGRGRPAVEPAVSGALVAAVGVGDGPSVHRMFTMLPLRLATNSTDNRLLSGLRLVRSFCTATRQQSGQQTRNAVF